MTTKVLAGLLLASSSMLADWRVGVGVGVGPVYPPAQVYEAPPPECARPTPYGYVSPYVYDGYVAPVPYVQGYWESGGYNYGYRRHWDRDRYYRRYWDHDWDRHHRRDWDHDRDWHGRW